MFPSRLRKSLKRPAYFAPESVRASHPGLLVSAPEALFALPQRLGTSCPNPRHTVAGTRLRFC